MCPIMRLTVSIGTPSESVTWVPEIMAGLVEGQIKTVHLSQFPRQQDKIATAVNIEHIIPLLLVPVFFNDS